MESKTDCPIFILTYGRANKVITHRTLRKSGYTGEIFLVCSDDDVQLDEYKETYGDDVCVFSKSDYKDTFDIGDNFNDERVVVYARNAVFDLAEARGKEYFIVLDDDYTVFRYTADSKGEFLGVGKYVQNMDRVIASLLTYYKGINAKTLCIAQGGDFIGGENSAVFKRKLSRKAMNFFLCSTKRRFKFVGRINEDVNTYVRQGAIGDIFLTICDLRLEQFETQSNTGGLTDFYLDGGTYVKSFYTLLFSPSCVTIRMMGTVNKRLHHQVSWKFAVPKLIAPQFNKDDKN